MGCFTLAGMDALAVVLMREFSAFQVTWSRFTFHAVLLVLVFIAQGDRRFFRTVTPKTQWLRGLCMIGVNLLLYIALQSISLAEATALMYLSPVLVTLLAGVLLGERISSAHLLAVLAGFMGVLVITQPGFATVDPAVFLVLIAAFLLAVYFLMTRKVSSIDSGRTSLFYTSIVGAIVLSLSAPWWWQWPTLQQWILLICMGGLGATGHFFFIKAYSLLPASELSPWLNAQVVAATLFSVFLFHDALAWNFFLGAVLIVGACVALWLTARMRALKK